MTCIGSDYPEASVTNSRANDLVSSCRLRSSCPAQWRPGRPGGSSLRAFSSDLRPPPRQSKLASTWRGCSTNPFRVAPLAAPLRQEGFWGWKEVVVEVSRSALPGFVRSALRAGGGATEASAAAGRLQVRWRTRTQMSSSRGAEPRTASTSDPHQSPAVSGTAASTTAATSRSRPTPRSSFRRSTRPSV